MTTTTTNMGLILPDVGITAGPTYATLLDNALAVIDSHDHSTGNGSKITPSGINISSDLSFAGNNATNLRSLRLYNESSFTTGVNDRTCFYALNNELYFVDGAGNTIQMTAGGNLNLGASISSLVMNDSTFTLQYFGDTSKKFRFDAANIISGVTRIFSLPDSGSNDIILTKASTATITNKSLSDSTTKIVEASDTTKSLSISLSGATTGKTTTIISSQTDNRNITLPDATGIVVLRDAVEILNNKSFNSSTVIKGANTLVFNNAANTYGTSLSAGSNVANAAFKLPIADGSSGQVVVTDGSGQLGFTTIPTTSGNVAAQDSDVTFTNADNRHQSVLPTAARTYKLPTTTIPSGDTWIFENRSTFLITVNSSGGNLVGYIYPGKQTQFIALQATPTDAAHWDTQYRSLNGVIAANDSNVVFSAYSNKVQISTPTAARTHTLPTTGIKAGEVWEFCNQSSTAANIITLNASGGSTVDYVLPTGYLKVISLQDAPTTSAHWKVLDSSSLWITVTPTGSWLANTTYTGRYRRLRNTLIYDVKLTLAGAPTSATLTITYPSGWLVDTSAMYSSTNSGDTIIGFGKFRDNSSTLRYNADPYYGTTSTFGCQAQAFSSSSNHETVNITDTVPITFAANDTLSFHTEVPISGWN